MYHYQYQPRRRKRKSEDSSPSTSSSSTTVSLSTRTSSMDSVTPSSDCTYTRLYTESSPVKQTNYERTMPSVYGPTELATYDVAKYSIDQNHGLTHGKIITKIVTLQLH